MKCPLLKITRPGLMEVSTNPRDDCLGEECAWWYAENGVCAVLTLTQGIVYLHKALLHLQEQIKANANLR